MKHKHHIIPKHMGGSDDPSNLVELTPEEHALAHKKLWEEHGKIQDYAAWKGLEGLMKKAEIVTYLQSTGSKQSNAKRLADGTHNFVVDNPSKRRVAEGTHHFQQDIGNRPADIAQRQLVKDGKHYWQSKEHAETVGKRTKAAIESGNHPLGSTQTCPHCGKSGQSAAMKRWHFNNCKSI